MKSLYLVGGGGHCHSCIDVIEQSAEYKIAGIFDIKENVGKNVLGYPIIGIDDDLKKYIKPENYFFITVGQIKSADLRITLYEVLKNNGANIATIISPRAYVSKYASVDEGTIVMHDSLINTYAEVGVNCIINTKTLIEHDAKVGNHCHISTATVVNGNCVIKDQCFIGSNAVLKEGIIVAEKTIIPAGSFYRGK